MNATLYPTFAIKVCVNQAILILVLFIVTCNSGVAGEQSTCFGSTANGKLLNGVELPAKGNNFESYSSLAGTLGRTYVHSTVRNIIVDAYQALENGYPGKVYKYAETGFKEGGKFKPHKTHQNGLSVDFIVPVINKKGESLSLPTNVFNKWGYEIEFDGAGKYGDYSIDFESLGAHIVTLHKIAKKHGADLWRVIFDPGLQPYLYKTKYGKYIKENILVPKKKSWVRHDDHYHVDFSVECKPLGTAQ